MKVPKFTVCWKSRATGNRGSSACATKKAAVLEAMQLYKEGATDVQVIQNGEYQNTAINWRKVGAAIL